MKRIERIREMSASVNGVQQIVADIMVSTAEDLPGLDEIFCGCKLLPGTIAYVVQEGIFYTLDDDGEWYASGAA